MATTVRLVRFVVVATNVEERSVCCMFPDDI